jgi:hypothetical protein
MLVESVDLAADEPPRVTAAAAATAAAADANGNTDYVLISQVGVGVQLCVLWGLVCAASAVFAEVCVTFYDTASIV